MGRCPTCQHTAHAEECDRQYSDGALCGCLTVSEAPATVVRTVHHWHQDGPENGICCLCEQNPCGAVAADGVELAVHQAWEAARNTVLSGQDALSW